MKLIFIALFIILLSSCSLGFEKNIKIIGHYYLTAPDDGTQLNLTYCDPKDSVGGCSGLVGATVFSIGYNKNYIIAKQHPNSNRMITNYFIVPLNSKIKVWGNNFGVIGPLSAKEFNNKTIALGIQNIQFTINEENIQ